MRTIALTLLVGTVVTVAQSKPAEKVDICHRRGNGEYRVLSIDEDAVPAHLAHGDGFFYAEVPGMPGFIFGPACELCPHP